MGKPNLTFVEGVASEDQVQYKDPNYKLMGGVDQYGNNYYLTNAFVLDNFTNGMMPYECRIGMSNKTLVSCLLSNGVPLFQRLSP